MPINEFLNSVKNAFQERVSNPLLGSFVLSWVILNWDLILLAASKKKNIQETIAVILKIKQTDIDKVLIYPFVLGIIYCIASPWVTIFFNWTRNRAISKLKENKITEQCKIAEKRLFLIEIESKTEVAREDIIFNAENDRENLRIETKNRELEYDKRKEEIEEESKRSKILIDELNNDSNSIEKLKQQVFDQNENIKKLESQIETYKKQTSNNDTYSLNKKTLTGENNNIAKRKLSNKEGLLLQIAKSDHGISEKKIIESSSFEKIKIQHFIDIFLKEQLVSKEHYISKENGSTQNIYKITAKGREQLVSWDLI